METAHHLTRLADSIPRIVEAGKRPVSLGGDPSITYPILRGIGKQIPAITLVHFDAHPDLYADYEGNPHSHASPFARIMDAHLLHRLIEFGVHTLNAHQYEQADKYGVTIFEIKDLPDPTHLNLTGPIYVSFDMDALDPAFAPGVSHWKPGALTTRDAISYIHALPGPIIGGDIVEFNPVHDATGLTAMVAAKILKELLGKMLAG